MAHTSTLDSWLNDTTELRKASPDLTTARGLPFMAVGLAVVLLSWWLTSADQLGRFWHAYLIATTYFTSIALGGLFFVVVLHLTGAHWGVVLRRLGEFVAMGIGICALMNVPIWVLILSGDASLYAWNNPGLGDPLSADFDSLFFEKRYYFLPLFYVGRQVFFFLLWFLLARYYYRSSVTQDRAVDNRPMAGVRWWAGPAMILFALSINFASMDWLMTLRWSWFSTIFGVYYFAGCAVAIFAVLAVLAWFLQWRGVLTKTVTVEHYHDIGKLLFGFIVFWGYIAFSQFLLIWYANIPEEVQWYSARQISATLTGISDPTKLLFIFHLFVPFLGLLSRHIRRNKAILASWGVYMLVVHWFDLFYIVAYEQGPADASGWTPPLSITEVVPTLGLGLVFIGYVLWVAAGRWLVPVRDPKIGLSLDFKNL